jgi:hypothetical protein
VPRNTDPEPSVRLHLWVFESDLEWLRETYAHNIGVSQAVRKLIRAYRRRVETKVASQGETTPQVKLSELIHD